MKNLLKFKRAVERKSGLNNPLLDKIIAQVGFDKNLVPAYSKQVKLDDLYYKNLVVKKFIDDLYKLAMNLIKKEDTNTEIKDLQALKKDITSTYVVLADTKNKFFKNERMALSATDAAEIAILDRYLVADKEEVRKLKKQQQELLTEIEYVYKKESGYI